MTEIDKLFQTHKLTKNEYLTILENWEDPEIADAVLAEAQRIRKEVYGTDVFVRGLIEFTNVCKQDCYYCGIRKSNPDPDRYRLKKNEILACCEYGYHYGFRTFVLQGGEDGYYSDDILVPIVSDIKENYPDCALTLSVGERSFESYEKLKEAGADRYLLRHETADENHYRHLHPEELSLQTRMNCLYDLKSLGYQVGDGFMVGSPYQTMECIAADLVFIQELEPEMLGIGPFIPHHDTSFADHPAGSVDLTLFLISLLRIILPDALIPATTAVATLDPKGREKAILAGANVIMLNITPLKIRDQYSLYDNKICYTEDIEALLKDLEESLGSLGFQIVCDRGDCRKDPSAEAASIESEQDEIEAEFKKKKKKKKKKKNKKKEKKKEEQKQKEKSSGKPKETDKEKKKKKKKSDGKKDEKVSKGNKAKK